jgi:hypothetical protein
MRCFINKTHPVSFATAGNVIFTPISLTAQRNGGKTAKETPFYPCVAPATAVPFIRGQSAPPDEL